jgi:2,3-dihydroxybenzoate decarboxylase
MRRIAVEEAFITPEILDGLKAVLDGKNPEPGFVAMGKCLLGPRGKPLFDKLLDLGLVGLRIWTPSGSTCRFCR